MNLARWSDDCGVYIYGDDESWVIDTGRKTIRVKTLQEVKDQLIELMGEFKIPDRVFQRIDKEIGGGEL